MKAVLLGDLERGGALGVADTPSTSPLTGGAASTPPVVPPAFTDPTRTARVGRPPPPPGATSLQALQLGASVHPDGRDFCTAALAEVRARRARGERCIAVFDIDNTLLDTRPRTVAAARAFGRQYGIRHLARLTLADADVDGRSTCLRLGLGSGALTDAFHSFWLEQFWKPESFALDQPILEMIALARVAHDAGAEVYYLTGRIAALEGVTRTQLRDLETLGLPRVDDANLVCKQDLTHRTAEMKANWLRERRDEGAHLAFFISEGVHDIAQLKRAEPGCACVLLGFPVGVDPSRVPADVPLFPLPVPSSEPS